MQFREAKDQRTARMLGDRLLSHVVHAAREFRVSLNDLWSPQPEPRGPESSQLTGKYLDELMNGAFQDAYTEAYLAIGSNFDVPQHLAVALLTAEVEKGRGEPSTLVEEYRGIAGVLLLSRHFAGEFAPVLRHPDAADREIRVAPIFDFTHPAAAQAIRANGPGGSTALIERTLGSPGIIPAPMEWAAAAAANLLTASLEVQLAGIAGLLRAGQQPIPHGVGFTLVCSQAGLVVERFFQSRYAPVGFGRSKLATGYLASGVYGFQTPNLGTPPPMIDTTVHAVSPQYLTGFAATF